LLILILAGQF